MGTVHGKSRLRCAMSQIKGCLLVVVLILLVGGGKGRTDSRVSPPRPSMWTQDTCLVPAAPFLVNVSIFHGRIPSLEAKLITFLDFSVPVGRILVIHVTWMPECMQTSRNGSHEDAVPPLLHDMPSMLSVFQYTCSPSRTYPVERRGPCMHVSMYPCMHAEDFLDACMAWSCLLHAKRSSLASYT